MGDVIKGIFGDIGAFTETGIEHAADPLDPTWTPQFGGQISGSEPLVTLPGGFNDNTWKELEANGAGGPSYDVFKTGNAVADRVAPAIAGGAAFSGLSAAGEGAGAAAGGTGFGAGSGAADAAAIDFGEGAMDAVGSGMTAPEAAGMTNVPGGFADAGMDNASVFPTSASGPGEVPGGGVEPDAPKTDYLGNAEKGAVKSFSSSALNKDSPEDTLKNTLSGGITGGLLSSTPSTETTSTGISGASGMAAPGVGDLTGQGSMVNGSVSTAGEFNPSPANVSGGDGALSKLASIAKTLGLVSDGKDGLSMGKNVLPAAGLGLTAYNQNRSANATADAQKNLQQTVQPAADVSAQLLQQFQSGQINASDAQAISDWQTQQLAQTRQYFQKAGLSGSSAAKEAEGKITQQAQSMRDQALQNLLKGGLSAVSTASQPLQAMAGQQLAQDTQLQNAMANFVQNSAKTSTQGAPSA